MNVIGYMGSPPPMRGKEGTLCLAVDTVGITPAYAGKSEKARNCVIFTGDHPRLCGEKAFRSSAAFAFLGSPPPMRGKAAKKNSERRRNRITPAYAGKSVLGDQCCHLSGDHPRLCGEKRRCT